MRPLLIAVDDLQWADVASLRWLSFFARRVEGVRVGVLAAVRPIEDEDPVVAELLADPATTLIRPTALTAAAVEELVRATLSPRRRGALRTGLPPRDRRESGSTPDSVRSRAAAGHIPMAGASDRTAGGATYRGASPDASPRAR